MVKTVSNKSNVQCQSEYGILKQVVLCEPKYMEIKEVINDVQKNMKMTILIKNLPLSSTETLSKRYVMPV